MLQDIGNLGQGIAAIIAIVGIPLAVKQLGMQTRVAQLDVLHELEAKWLMRTEQPLRDFMESIECDPMHRVFSNATLSVIEAEFDRMEVSPAFRPNEIQDYVPRLLMSLAPAISTSDPDCIAGRTNEAPRNEPEYEAALLQRCALTFSILDRLSSSQASTEEQKDLVRLADLVYGYTVSASEIVELFDFGLASPDKFLEKRHLAAIREIHMIEPFLLWQAIRFGDHRSTRALRTLALGAAARTLTWMTDLHGQTGISIRLRPHDHFESAGYGPFLRSGGHLESLPRRLRRLARSYLVSRPFRDPTKGRQNRLIDRAKEIYYSDM